MVSYTDLIYEFTQNYLKIAMECSICKENYDMNDDYDTLSDSLKFFMSLVTRIEKDETLEMEDIRPYLEKYKEEQLDSFFSFIQNRVAIKALDNISKNEMVDSQLFLNQDSIPTKYAKSLSYYMTHLLGEDVEQFRANPSELLMYIRRNEENI